MFLSLITGWLAFLAQRLGAKVAMITVVIGAITAVILGVKLAIVALIAAIPYTPLPAGVIAASSSLLPANLGTCIEVLIDARLLLLLFESKWIYLKTVMSLMSMKFL